MTMMNANMMMRDDYEQQFKTPLPTADHDLEFLLLEQERRLKEQREHRVVVSSKRSLIHDECDDDDDKRKKQRLQHDKTNENVIFISSSLDDIIESIGMPSLPDIVIEEEEEIDHRNRMTEDDMTAMNDAGRNDHLRQSLYCLRMRPRTKDDMRGQYHAPPFSSTPSKEITADNNRICVPIDF
eukprot:CAMPEP_0119551032 /NCGR_PEP_ID=MMETSP1352-20130426/4423_1 /TAXON_ID=265584 /ORGANISM="Stauroneis constricta, Strain CCMP1120" /LENGTH=182 /DNA_ID=CAMNT_0007597037 /DNA_START=166 /DNA_END=714 /DNA_ORIENTATION=-